MERSGEGRESHVGVRTGSDVRQPHARAAHSLDHGGKNHGIALGTCVLGVYEGRTYQEVTCTCVPACSHGTGLSRPVEVAL